jgi:hypothetical protein
MNQSIAQEIVRLEALEKRLAQRCEKAKLEHTGVVKALEALRDTRRGVRELPLVDSAHSGNGANPFRARKISILKALRPLVPLLPDKFTVETVCRALEEKQPELKAQRDAVAWHLWSLARKGEIRNLNKGHGRKHALYGKPIVTKPN